MKVRVDDAVLEAARARDVTGIASAKHDATAPRRATDMLIVLAPPRSGSTFFCDAIWNHGLCHPEEYFNRRFYMPIFAERWGCIRDGEIDFPKFGAMLIAKRTSPKGWLGVKVLAFQVGFFLESLDAFSDLRKHWVVCRRRDRFAQAVSLDIANQSQAWRSDYPDRDVEVEYDFQRIKQCLGAIVHAENVIDALLGKLSVAPMHVYYEDIARDLDREIRRVPGVRRRWFKRARSRYKKQGTERNAAWVQRFAAEYLEETLRNQASS